MPPLRPNFSTSNLQDPTRGARGSLESVAGLLSQYEKEQQFDATRGDKMLNQALLTQDRKDRLALQEKELAARNAARAQARADKTAAANANLSLLGMIGSDTKEVDGIDETKLGALADVTSTQLDRPTVQPDPALTPFAATASVEDRARAEGLKAYEAQQGSEFFEPKTPLERAGETVSGLLPSGAGIMDKIRAGTAGGVIPTALRGLEYLTTPTSEADRLSTGTAEPKKEQTLNLGQLTMQAQKRIQASDDRMQTKILEGNAATKQQRKDFYANDADIREEFGLNTKETVLKSIQEKVDPMIEAVNAMPAGAAKNALAAEIVNYHKTLLATDSQRATKLLDRAGKLQDQITLANVKANNTILTDTNKQALKDAQTAKSRADHRKDYDAMDFGLFDMDFEEYLKDKKIK